MYWSSISIIIWFSVCLEVSCVVFVAHYTYLLFRVPLTFTDDKYDYMHYAYGFCNVVIMAASVECQWWYPGQIFILKHSLQCTQSFEGHGSFLWVRAELGQDSLEKTVCTESHMHACTEFPWETFFLWYSYGAFYVIIASTHITCREWKPLIL